VSVTTEGSLIAEEKVQPGLLLIDEAKQVFQMRVFPQKEN